ncbi:protein ROLLING AND ERECT LEAF 2-like [Andrographis paniculata]|uniref:protein ROLLING AND ERECT LEAF 2-like n=1 Tax=Andrographis paniculata TaxID=175694 RepID=UPI0021E8892B|nr:protein ROLLING AND ERECT LEAF 2-like [Andrographis paniculata]
MGCTQSKIENEETVNRCKERKQHMERAVTARNKFAAAHSGYAMSLKNTGAALSDFSQGEAVYPPSGVSSVQSSTIGVGAPLPPPRLNEIFHPPPPPTTFADPPTPLQRSATMPEISIPRPDNLHSDPIIEEENEEDVDGESIHSLKRRSSKSRGRRGGASSSEVIPDEPLHPPHKPDRRGLDHQQQNHPPPPPHDDKGMWDYFFLGNMPGPTLAPEENSIEREEMERKMMEERHRAREREAKKTEKVEVVPDIVEPVSEILPPPPLPAEVAIPGTGKVPKRVKPDVPPEEKRKGAGNNMNLMQIFIELDNCFLSASESAHDVSRMLEATRLHYHSNFADKRGHINHSERVMRVITWNRSFRGFQQNLDDGVDDFDSEENETHATVLDKMLAWEKKLYDEVKTGEQMKLEYQKKVASLNKLKKRGTNTEALERMKASVSHLHTRYIVDMQSMDSTVSEINRLRDEQLYPKLVALVDGMAAMWETMRTHHESQTRIVQNLRSLDISQAPKETSDHHHERTRQLGGVVQEWHNNFSELMSQQKEYVRMLNHWLKLNLVPIDTNWKEKVSSPGRSQNPPIQRLLLAWNEYLEKLPDEPAKATISNFAAIIKTIWQYQKEEMDYRNRCTESRKELIRKTREFENWYNKYMQKRTPPDELDPDRAHDKELINEKQQAVEMAKHNLEQDEEAYQKQCIQVRDKSLMSLKTSLPDLFRVLSDFSLACSDMYNRLRSIIRSRN